jgi:hypothetical protein
VPLRVTVCGDPAALSATVRVALKLATDAGVNVMLMLQLDPAASDEPQVLVCEKSVGLAPVMVMPLMVSAALPVLESVAVCEAVVVPLVDVKLSVAGVRDAMGAGGTAPVPVRAMLCGEPVALSVIETVAVSLPGVVGANFTVIVQVALAASGLALTQLSLSMKFAEFAPVMAILVIVSGPNPELVRVTLCGALVVPSVWLPKLSAGGARLTTGKAEKFAVTLCGALIVTVVEALLLLATAPVQLLKV